MYCKAQISFPLLNSVPRQEGVRGNRVIASPLLTYAVIGGEWSASRHDFTSGKTAPTICVIPTDGPNENLFPCWEANHRREVRKPFLDRLKYPSPCIDTLLSAYYYVLRTFVDQVLTMKTAKRLKYTQSYADRNKLKNTAEHVSKESKFGP